MERPIARPPPSQSGGCGHRTPKRCGAESALHPHRVPDGLRFLEVEDGVGALGSAAVAPADFFGVEVDDAFDVFGGGFLDVGDGVGGDAGGVDGVDVHVGGEPGDELALDAGDEVDDAGGDVGGLEDFAEGDRRPGAGFAR